jgi:hypothetical protein
VEVVVTDEGSRVTPDSVSYVEEEFLLFLQAFATGKGGKPLSEGNVQKTIRAVRLLLSGDGVRHKGWQCAFRAHNPVRFEEDLEEVRESSRAFVELHGSDPNEKGVPMPGKDKERVKAVSRGVRYDPSNGWHIRHPLRKLQEYKMWKREMVRQSRA